MIQKAYKICNKDSYEPVIEVTETFINTTAIMMLSIFDRTALLTTDEAQELIDVMKKILTEKSDGSNHKTTK